MPPHAVNDRAGTPLIFKSSAEMNSACGKVPPCGETLERRKGAEFGAKEARSMPDGILIIDKPVGWTSMDVCLPTRSLTARGPL